MICSGRDKIETEEQKARGHFRIASQILEIYIKESK